MMVRTMPIAVAAGVMFSASAVRSMPAAPFDAVANVLDGEAEFAIGGRRLPVRAAESMLMAASVPHAVQAPGKMRRLIVIRGTKDWQTTSGVGPSTQRAFG